VQTDLLNIQMSDSKDNKVEDLYFSKNLTVIDYTSCEQHLKDIGVINKNDSIIILSTEWDSDIKTGTLINENKTDINSLSYNLYTSTGTKIDIALCQNNTSQVKMHLDGLDISNITDYSKYDINATTYSDICIPMRKNDTAATINERRDTFDNLNYTCSTGCTYQNINITVGYLICNCNTANSNVEVAPEYGKVVLNSLESINIFILKCYKEFILYVL